MSAQVIKHLSYEKFKKYILAIESLQVKVTELKEKHPLYDHYQMMHESLKIIDRKLYYRYHLKYFEENLGQVS